MSVLDPRRVTLYIITHFIAIAHNMFHINNPTQNIKRLYILDFERNGM